MEIDKVTIHDVANALNINSSKVSRALNDSPRVTKKKDKFFKTARQMDYQRNLLAANLRRNVTTPLEL